ncbi:MAG: transglycosylase domain-containing protein [Acidimicrobiia bacterium]|nr:transglycosylase domain-containing protein [Acidimicrobiia bacterium]
MEPPIRTIEREERDRRRLPALIGLGIVVLVGATWLGLFAFLSVNTAYGTVQEVEEAYLCNVDEYDLSFPNLSTLSSVHTADGVLLGELSERNSLPVALDEMPDLVVGALLSAEDKSFYEHEGIDFTAIGRAVLGRLTNQPAGGGSTITQQVVKQNFLTSEQTIERKICEAVVAAELERRYTKDQILEFWANSVFFGSNAYGIRAASLEYFGKELDELTIAEAALLPIPIRNPTFYHPRFEPQNALAARNRTIDRMVANGYILPFHGTRAKAEPLGVIGSQESESISPQVLIAVHRQLLQNEEFSVLGSTQAERKRAIFGCPASVTDCDGGGGLRIDITIDQGLQDEANRILRSWFRDPAGPTGAIATVDNETGAIRVLASGVEFGTDTDAGQRPYDLAGLGARQAGSAFKPFTLAAALETGDRAGNPVTLGSYWDDSSPARIECARPCPPDGDYWEVSNAGGSSGKGLRTLDSATYNSTNTVYARLVNAIGPEAVVDMASKLGVESPLSPFLSITLGAQEVSPLEMAAAYSTLANYGTRHDHYLIERITDRDGTVIYEHAPEPREVLSPPIAAAVVGSIEKVVSNGTAPRADIGRAQAGKTGTTTDHSDVWFVGFVPQMTTSVWVGFADSTDPLEGITVFNDVEQKEQAYRRAFGGTLAAPIWNQFMTHATRTIAPVPFPDDPPGTDIYRQTPYSFVPELTESTGDMIDAVYAVGLAGTIQEVGSNLPAGTLIGVQPAPGSLLRQGTQVAIEVSNGVPPEVPMIDLRGLDAAEANSRLAEFRTESGIVFTWSFAEIATTNPAQEGVVVSTTPPPGTPIREGQQAIVRFGRGL